MQRKDKLGLTAFGVAALSLIAYSSAPAQQQPGPDSNLPSFGIPRGMVSFFELPNCPPGWRNVNDSWRGRYVVIAHESIGTQVGTPLASGENRVTGEHSHTTGVAFYGGDCPGGHCASWGGRHGIDRGPLATTRTTAVRAGETVAPGTNAPYVTLRACAKQ